MVFIIRGNLQHVKRSCRSDASDWVTGKNPHIPPSAVMTLNAIGGIAISYRYRYRARPFTVLPSRPIIDFLSLAASTIFETVAARCYLARMHSFPYNWYSRRMRTSGALALRFSSSGIP
eukprot:896053-Pleurochrysis_carterae.AAC.1